MIIGYLKGQRRTAFTIAEHMRARGKVAETDIENKTFEKLKQYADENIKSNLNSNAEGREIEQLIYIMDQNTAIIYKPQTAEIIETTVTDILDFTLNNSYGQGKSAIVMSIH